MENNKIIKVLKRKEKCFVHLPVEIPTVLIKDPSNDPNSPEEKIYLPEAFHINFKKFIAENDPGSWVFIKRGLDERHQEKNIRKYLIFSETVKDEFDKFIENFSEKYNIKIIIE